MATKCKRCGGSFVRVVKAKQSDMWRQSFKDVVAHLLELWRLSGQICGDKALKMWWLSG